MCVAGRPKRRKELEVEEMKMARLISYDYIRQKALADPDSGKAIVYLQDISEAPTVDAVPVVRCRDCKHLMFSDFYGECGKGHMGVVSPDDFCSRGEWKEGAD